MGEQRGKITETIGNVTISSSFDSGNLDRAEECKCETPDTFEYNLWTAPDCAGTECENGNRTWFYFSVTTPPNIAGKTLRFNILNMNKQSRLYQQGMAPMVKVTPGRGGWERLRERVDYKSGESGLELTFQYTVTENRKLTTYFAFCYPYSYSECQRKLARLDERFSRNAKDPEPTDNGIYYHRELLCFSLEGLRVDLITISSFNGITNTREPRFTGLFPDSTTSRAKTFQGKKVIFLTSRVHPGESPSSHVFNGFLDFIIRTDDPRAQVVRKLFVFKLIPMLNPDGVYRGHYRTDVKGVNLNRMYLDPDPELHPSVYGTRCLVLHHHMKGSLSAASEQGSRVCRDAHESTEIPLEKKPQASSENSSTYTLQPDSRFKGVRNCHSDPNIIDGLSQQSCSLPPQNTKSITPTDYQCPRSISHQVTPPANCLHGVASPAHRVGSDLATHSIDPIACLRNDHSLSASSERSRANNSHQADAIAITRQSGIALYVDLHAHATKRGCFLYGNYFRDEPEQVENMLFPKVVSLNSPHLDFDHCVFSEKNMYTADKKDGLSKEGSGRVALYKATGIIHSYTLECNYNSGRMCNPVSAATLDGGRATPPPSILPMAHRYSIADYEQVGRALAVSALDMHQVNPWSRLPTSKYGSLEGVRQALLLRIRNSRTKANRLTPSYPKPIPLAHQEGLGAVPTGTGDLEQEGDRLSAVLVPRTLILRRQKKLATAKGSGQIAADIAQLTEARQQYKVASKGGTAPRKLLLRRTARSAKARRQLQESEEHEGTPQPLKPSMKCVAFPSSLKSGTREGANGSTTASAAPASKNGVSSHSRDSFWITLRLRSQHLKQEGVPKAVCVTGHDGRMPQQCVADTFPLPIVKHRRTLMSQRHRRLITNSGSLLLSNAGVSTPVQAPNTPKAASDSELMVTQPAQLQMRHRSSKSLYTEKLKSSHST